MRIFSILLLALFAIPVLAQVEVKTQQTKIQGIWYSKSTDDQMILKLSADGSGELDGEAIKYTIKDNKFTVTIVAEAETIVYRYDLQGNSLTISGGDLEEPVTFSRRN